MPCHTRFQFSGIGAVILGMQERDFLPECALAIEDDNRGGFLPKNIGGTFL